MCDGVDEVAMFEHRAARRHRMTRRCRAGRRPRPLNEIANAAVFNAVGIVVREREQVGDGLVTNQLEETGIPGDHPAIQPQRRRHEGGGLNLVRMLGGEHQSQNGAGRKTARDHHVAILAHVKKCVFSAAIPINPG